MAFQKVDNFNEVWKHEKEDDMIQGVLIQRRADIGKYKKTVYTLECKGRRKIDVFGSKALDDQMRKIIEGDLIQIKYLGMKMSKTNNSYHAYEVLKDDGIPEQSTAEEAEVAQAAIPEEVAITV